MSGKDKVSLRVKYREIRKGITERTAKEKSISDFFLKSKLYKDCQSLFIYSATGSEVCIDHILKKALYDGKKVAFPVCTDRDGNMDFYFISDTKQLKSGMYGIKEPDINICEPAFCGADSVCLVPGLCFDLKGGRLGYGKGYYDRFLEKFSGIAVGICFEECLSDEITLGNHDKKVNYLITDKRIYIFSDSKEE